MGCSLLTILPGLFRYNGYISYKADIATIVIEGHFEYQPHIAPACLEFVETEAEKYPKNGTYALVAGWGENKVELQDSL